MKKNKKLIVVKMGSGLLADEKGGIDHRFILNIVEQTAKLRKLGHRIILVSSGAISSGMTVLKLRKRPKELSPQQICSSIGQPLLMQAYNDAFAKFGMCTAQILLTSWDLDSQKIYRNAQETIEELLKLGHCVPIFNENDAISFEEIAFGDNDILSGHITLLAGASKLIILSTIDGLRTRKDGTGELIRRVRKVDAKIMRCAGRTRSARSIGGMISKVKTAKWMMENGVSVTIASGRKENVLLRIIKSEAVGTLFEK